MPSEDELLDKLQGTEARLKTAAKKILENRRMLLKLYADKQIMREPLIKINEKGIYLDHLTKMFENAANSVLTKKQQKLSIAVSKIDGLSPLKTLNRGYSIAKNVDGIIVKSINQVKSGDCMTVKVSDGEIYTIIK